MDKARFRHENTPDTTAFVSAAKALSSGSPVMQSGCKSSQCFTAACPHPSNAKQLGLESEPVLRVLASPHPYAYTIQQLLSMVWLRSSSLTDPLLGTHHRVGLEISAMPCLKQGDRFPSIAEAASPHPAREWWDLWRSCQLLHTSQSQTPTL